MKLKLVGGPMDNSTFVLTPGPDQRTIRPPDSMAFDVWNERQERTVFRYYARHDKPIPDNDPTFELVYKYREKE